MKRLSYPQIRTSKANWSPSSLCVHAIIIALVVLCNGTSYAARLDGDFTDDISRDTSSPSMVDVFDYMIWNNFAFGPVTPPGALTPPDVGDADNSGIVDGGDFLVWNNNKYTSDGSGTCNFVGPTPCVSDATYRDHFKNGLGFPVAGPSVIEFTNNGDVLSVAISGNAFLQAFAIRVPRPVTDPVFTSTFEPEGYMNGRYQTVVGGPTPGSGIGSSGSGIVATFPSGALAAGYSVFWQAEAGVPRGGRAVVTGLTLVPDGDFNDDGLYDCLDVDELVMELSIGSTDLYFDLTGDGMITVADLDAWRAEAGEVNLGPGKVYLEGDATLDGTVDGADFLQWNSNKFTSASGWCGGDFNADGFTDGSDFLVWNTNKFTSADTASVPEPASWTLLLLYGAAVIVRRKDA